MSLARPIVEEAMAPTHGPHQPVLLREALDLLRPAAGGVFVDATVGPGGHAEALLEAVGKSGRVVGIDRDPAALAFAAARLRRFGDRLVLRRGDHGNLRALLDEAGIAAVDGVLADLGISSLQLDDPSRGFSFRGEGPLDMRIDPSAGPSAADLLAGLGEAELARILAEFGEERRAPAIARAVVRERPRRPILRAEQLVAIVERVAGAGYRRARIHPATRTFQALRIAVNGEIEPIGRLVEGAVSQLRSGGRVVVLSYHSLEDRAVKRAFRDLAERCVCPPKMPVCGCGRENLVRVLTRRPIVPSAIEIAGNPRARSARLRAAEKL